MNSLKVHHLRIVSIFIKSASDRNVSWTCKYVTFVCRWIYNSSFMKNKVCNGLSSLLEDSKSPTKLSNWIVGNVGTLFWQGRRLRKMISLDLLFFFLLTIHCETNNVKGAQCSTPDVVISFMMLYYLINTKIVLLRKLSSIRILQIWKMKFYHN